MTSPAPIRVGRYVLYGEIAAGGMAAVHFGRVRGDASFARLVAIKRLHPHLAKEADLAAMFVDEARIAARIHHPNVANILDVVSLPEGELLIVMEYVAGESLSRVIRRLAADGDPFPPEVACAIVCDALGGLHAAHEAKDDQGQPLGIIHRDVSPQNILVGADGVSRLVDFGVAKARGRMHATRGNEVKGKIAYMPPEQLRGKTIDRRCDVYAMGVVLWEALTCKRLFHADSEGETVTMVLEAPVAAPSTACPGVPKALDAVVLKALARDPAARFATARDMAAAIEAAVPIASARQVASFVQSVAGDVLAQRQQTVAELERRPDDEEPTGGAVTTTSPGRGASTTGRWLVLALLGAAVVAGVVVAPRLRPHPSTNPGPVQSNAAAQSDEVLDAAVASPPATGSSDVPHAAASHRVVVHVPSPHPTPRSSAPCPVKKFFEDGIWVYRRPERDERGECP